MLQEMMKNLGYALLDTNEKTAEQRFCSRGFFKKLHSTKERSGLPKQHPSPASQRQKHPYCGSLSAPGGWGTAKPARPGTAGSPSSYAGKTGYQGHAKCAYERPPSQTVLCKGREGEKVIGKRQMPIGSWMSPVEPASPGPPTSDGFDLERYFEAMQKAEAAALGSRNRRQDSSPLMTSWRSISRWGRQGATSRPMVCCQF